MSTHAQQMIATQEFIVVHLAVILVASRIYAL
jgi:hypothetical protein